MKRLWIIGTICLAGLQLADGQDMLSWGVKAGASLSNQNYKFTPIDYSMDTDIIPGPAISLFLEAFRGDHFSFQTDLGFICRGSATSIQSVTVNHLDQDRIIENEGELATSRFRCLSLAPMLRARSEFDRLTPYALFGPRIDMILDYHTDSEYPLEETNSLILGLAFGIGAEFGFSGKGLFAEVQYQPDLSPVTNQEPLLVNNNSLVFTLGIRWIRTP
jgi:hypothetical protein